MAVGGTEDNDRTTGWLPAPDEPPRPGPQLIEADTWGDPVDTVGLGSTYAGRHHVRSSTRIRLGIGAGVAALVAAVAIPWALTDSPSPTPPFTAGEPDLGDLPVPSLSGPGNDVVSTGPSAETNPGPATSAAGRPTPTTAAGGPTSPAGRPTTNPTTPARPPFSPLTFEAEAGSPQVTLGGSAWIAPYPGASNGRIARNVGDWDMRGGPGTVRFNGVTFPSDGTYVLTISFVHPDDEANRTAQVTVSGLQPVTVHFSGSARCCDVLKVNLVIPAGTRTITIANDTDGAPSIDKIVVSQG